MNDSSATRIIRWVISIPLTLCTTLTAVLWAWPKSGEGGFLWLLSLPVGLGFVYLTHLLTAPPRVPRSIGVPIALAAGLAALTVGGTVLGSMVLPVDGPSDLALAMMGMTFLWPWLAAFALVFVAVLKLVDRIVRRSRERTSVQAAMLSGQPAASAPVGTIGPAHETPFPAATRTPAPRDDRAPASSPAPPPAPGSTVLTEVRFLELATLVEVAASLEEATNPTMMLLTFGSDGVEVTAAETELGTVEGRWNGDGTVRTLQSARALHEALSGLSPAPTTLTLQPPVDDDDDLEISADTGQRVASEAVRA